MMGLAKTTAYGLIDVWARHRGIERCVGGERIRFPARYCRYYAEEYEPATFAFLREFCRPGATVLDVGAHLGLFSVTMARLVGVGGRVVSFEPTPSIHRVLRDIVRLNDCQATVEVRGEAAAETCGVATFYEVVGACPNNSSLLNHELGRAGYKVRTIGIDEFVTARGYRPSCLKIDVEGAELQVLRGSRRTLQEYRPAVSLAVHPPILQRSDVSLKELWDLFQQVNMTAVLDGQSVGREEFCNRHELFDVWLIPA